MDADHVAPTLAAADLEALLGVLREAHRVATRDFPGESNGRQPVHTVYGGAHLFRADTPHKFGVLASKALDDYAPDVATFARVFGLATDGDVATPRADTVRTRVLRKLRDEPVEDFRIDFEDGYGHRPDGEEDAHCIAAARQVAEAVRSGTLPPFIGLRIKPLSPELHRRALRTLDLFVSTLARAGGRGAFPRLLVALPKVISAGEVATAARACSVLEEQLGLPPQVLQIEIMIETPQAVIGADGATPLRALVAAGAGRVSAAHFGAFDFTALCGIAASHQSHRHPACDYARQVMQVALAQTGVRLSDSVTTVLPVPVHRGRDAPLTEAQRQENAEAVGGAWRLHADNIRHSLAHGFYQGWDLHPAQLAARYAAVYDFFLGELPGATARLRHFVEQATHATTLGAVFDDAATAQGLLTFFLRGLRCGALSAGEAAATGLTEEEIRGRSFARIIEGRRGPPPSASSAPPHAG